MKDHGVGLDSITARGEFNQARLDGARGRLRRFAVQIAGSRCRGRGRVRDLAGVGCCATNLAKIHLEFLGDDLSDLGMQPLPHLGAAMVQHDRAVGIHV